MDDEAVAQFTSVTGATPERALQYLQISEGNIEQAVTLYFETGGVDLGHEQQFSTSEPAHPSSSQPPPSAPFEDPSGIVHIDSDEDLQANVIPPSVPHDSTVEADEAMARRLQEEMYGEAPFGGHDPDAVRAPLARTTETLVDPGADMHDSILAQVRARQRGGHSNRPGIFNQLAPSSSSIWNDEAVDSRNGAQGLSRATGGASDVSSKNRSLAELFRPPFEITSKVDFEESRTRAREAEKWLLVNIQDPSVFDCQLINRDLWKDQSVQETVRENFIFMQNNKEDEDALQYIQYYFPSHDNTSSYPHIAIVDPRTGEQVKIWSGPPVPQASEFVMQLHEFLDRYSLKHNVRNPVAKRKPEVKKEKKIDMMSEEEMLEMALRNSLANEPSARLEDPDDLTRSIGDLGKGKGKAIEIEDDEMVDALPSDTNGHAGSTPTSTFASISSDRPHTEPSGDPATTTRIQFRHSGGRVIRRFSLTDPVRRIYEWLKASPLEGKEGVEFELVSLGKNLMDSLEDTVEAAGLKNGTVMIEFLEDEA